MRLEFSIDYIILFFTMVNNNEQTEEYEDIFYIFTFEEEDRKDLKTNDLKRKGNFGFGKFSYRKSILEFLILYIRNWSMVEKFITVTFEWIQRDLVTSCLWFEIEFRRRRLDFERVLKNVYKECLILTLRFLASGKNQQFRFFSFRIGRQSNSRLVAKTCKAICLLLKDIYLKSLETPEEWKNVSPKFKEL